MTADEFGAQHLERDLAVVPQVLRQVDRRHAAGADLAFDPVAVGEGHLEPAFELGHFGLLGWGGVKMRGSAAVG